MTDHAEMCRQLDITNINRQISTFVDALPKACFYLKQNGYQSVEECAVAARQWLRAHPPRPAVNAVATSQNTPYAPSQSQPQYNHRGQRGRGRGGFRGRPRSSYNGNQGNSDGNSQRSNDAIRRCYTCNSTDHLRRDCKAFGPNRHLRTEAENKAYETLFGSSEQDLNASNSR